MVCKKCGAELREGVTKCSACGEENGVTAVVVNGDDAEQNKVVSILAYIGILWLVPLLAAPNSKFARFHANQGLILFICEVIIGTITGVVVGVLIAINWVLGTIISSILGLVGLVFLVLAILGIVNVVNKQEKELPVIGGIRIIK